MPDRRLSYPYVKAFLDLSIQNGQLEAARMDMEALEKTGRETPLLIQVLRNPLVPAHKKKEIIKAIFAPLVHVETMAFLSLLADKERASLVFSVAEEFLSQYREVKNILSVDVLTAEPLSKEMEHRLLENLTQQFGKKIELHERVDPDLIGGLCLTIGDRQYDGTIRKTLKEIKKSLLDNRNHL